MIHHLKINPIPFDLIADGIKTFELRRRDNFKEGDRVRLLEYDLDLKNYTGRLIEAQITYVLNKSIHGLKEGHCIFCIKVISVSDPQRFKSS